MKIKEVAQLTGVTVRTLHYYDEIGLLKPHQVSQAGYRLYNEEDLALLQQILFFRELDFPLRQIKDILNRPGYDRTQALEKQRELLLLKRARLDGLLGLLERTLKGDAAMEFQEFDNSELEKTRQEYAREARERWGDTQAYRAQEEKTKNLTLEDWSALQEQTDQIFSRFAAVRDTQPDSPQAQSLVKAWQDFITEHFYPCSKEILAGLGEMYLSDERFTQTIDKAGEGTAEFLSKAIAAYCAG